MRICRVRESTKLYVALLCVSGSLISGTAGAPWGYGPVVGVESSGSRGLLARGESASSSPAVGYVAVSAGGRHYCALRTDRSAVCWGANEHGQADAPSGTFTAVSAGENHSCGLRTDRSAVCWGANEHGQADAPSGTFTAVSAGENHSCGLRTDRSVVCWGSSLSLFPPSGVFPFAAVSAGGALSCALRADPLWVLDGTQGGVVVCWDRNGSSLVVQFERLVTLSVGGAHACGILQGGWVGTSVVCWGNNSHGQSDVPSRGLVEVSAGRTHSCGLGRGSITCWGNNDYGKLRAPRGPFTAVSAGGDLSCGLRVNGAVVCWGSLRVVDEGTGGVHQEAIDALRRHVPGIFEGTGCEVGFCPHEPLTRWEMAVWLVRVLDRTDPARLSTSQFHDVNPRFWGAAHIDRLADLEITAGCDRLGLVFCPTRLVTRGQMATFLVRAFDLPTTSSAGFTDTDDNIHKASIDVLAGVGVTVGCSTEPLRYCPDRAVTRGQMATFLGRVLGIV